MTPTKKMMSVMEMAEHLGASRFTIYRAIQAGKIPAYRLGRKLMVDPDEVLTALRNFQRNTV